MITEIRITRKQLERLDLGRYADGIALGREAARAIQERVQNRGQDCHEKPLPPYALQIAPPQARSTSPRTGKSGWDETVRGVPPDVQHQIRTLGGKARRAAPGETATTYSRATAIFYGPRSPVRDKRGLLWGFAWPTRAALVADLYGGRETVDYTRLGAMWAGLQVSARADRKGKWAHATFVTVRFRGANVGGSVASVAKRYRGRKVPPSVKAVLTAAREKNGQPRPYLFPTGAETKRLLARHADRVLAQVRDLPSVTVSVKGGQ